MVDYIKNIDKSTIINLAQLVVADRGQVVSKTLAQNDALSITLFAFAQGEEISTHESKGDALVTILEGEAQITIGDEVFHVKAGESIVMPANTPHALKAENEPFKMLLVVVFPR